MVIRLEEDEESSVVEFDDVAIGVLFVVDLNADVAMFSREEEVSRYYWLLVMNLNNVILK